MGPYVLRYEIIIYAKFRMYRWYNVLKKKKGEFGWDYADKKNWWLHEYDIYDASVRILNL